MLRIVFVTALVLYGVLCWSTMPPQCFTIRDALACQRVQVQALTELRAVHWDFVHSIRRI